jgi:hypothetical protein
MPATTFTLAGYTMFTDINTAVARVEELELELLDMQTRAMPALMATNCPFGGISLRAAIERDILRQETRIAWAYLGLVYMWKSLGEASQEDVKAANAAYWAAVDAELAQ